MAKKLKVILGGVAGILIIILAAGFFAMSNTTDLGVRYTQKDTDSANAKLGITYSVLTGSNGPKSTLLVEGKREVDITLSNEELTALMAEHEGKWRHYPVSGMQVRVNEDGSLELSGKLKTNSLKDYALATNMPDRFWNFIEDKAKLIPIEPGFYIKGTVDVKGGQVTGQVKDARIGTFGVDTKWVSDNNEFVTDFVEERILAAGITPESVSFGKDGLHLKGMVPQQIGFAK